MFLIGFMGWLSGIELIDVLPAPLNSKNSKAAVMGYRFSSQHIHSNSNPINPFNSLYSFNSNVALCDWMSLSLSLAKGRSKLSLSINKEKWVGWVAEWFVAGGQNL